MHRWCSNILCRVYVCYTKPPSKCFWKKFLESRRMCEQQRTFGERAAKNSFNFGKKKITFCDAGCIFSKKPLQKECAARRSAPSRGNLSSTWPAGIFTTLVEFEVAWSVKKRALTVLMKFQRYLGQPQRQYEPAVSLASRRGLWRIRSSDSSYAIHVKKHGGRIIKLLQYCTCIWILK